MQSIVTTYYGASNVRGSRIRAKCDRGTIWIPYPHELSGDDVHRAAVDALVARFVAEDLREYGTPPEKNPWARPYVTGGLPGNTGCAHVFVDAP